MEVPSQKEAVQILRNSGCSEQVINHCIAVSKLAKEIAQICHKKGLKVDIKVVEIGGLLHDLGRAKTHGIRHSVIGGEIARSMGLSEPIISIIERHVGAGISKEEAKVLEIPERSYIPVTLEEKIVSYADKLIEGDRQVKIDETIGKFSRQLGNDHPAIGRLRALHTFFSDILKDNK